MHDEWSGKQTKLPACQPARRQSSQLALRSPEQPCHMLYPIRTSHGHFLLLCFLCKPRSRSHKVELTFTSLSKLLFQATITIDTYSFCLDGLRFSVINKSLGSYTVPYSKASLRYDTEDYNTSSRSRSVHKRQTSTSRGAVLNLSLSGSRTRIGFVTHSFQISVQAVRCAPLPAARCDGR